MAHHLLSGLGYFRDSDNESYTRNQQHIYKVCPTFMRHYDSVIPVSAVPAFSGDLLSSLIYHCCGAVHSLFLLFIINYNFLMNYRIML